MSDFISPSSKQVKTLFKGSDYPQEGNYGLIFEKYLKIWERGEYKKVSNPVSELKNFKGSFKGQDNSFVEEINKRQKKILSIVSNKTGAEFLYETSWRLGCGMGNDHPLENGFTMDYTTGLPYIPSSSIKGLLRSTAEFMAENESEFNKENIKELFGHESNDKTEHQMGDIVFFDSYPLNIPEIDIDIINVHHPKYYHYMGLKDREKEKEVFPTETETPVPVFFLTIAKGTQFNFRLFSRSGKKENLDLVETLLDDALKYLGVGAKTAVGYGRFVKPGEKAENGSSAKQWLKNAIDEISKKNNENNIKNIEKGKHLAMKWSEIEEENLKRSVFKEIDKIWKKDNLWNQNSKAIKAAKNIYLAK